jgi:RNA polymerase sigma factor (sigma-70 family)
MLERDADSVSDCYLYVCEHLYRNEYRRLRRFVPGGPASFRTWLFLVARNLALDWRRKKYGRKKPVTTVSHPLGLGSELLPLLRDEKLSSQMALEDISAEEIPDGRPDPESQAVSTEIQATLQKSVARLDGPSRLLIHLRFEQGLTLEQVARISGLSDAQTADRRIRSVLGVLRKEIA